jgi:hypothetical protein
VITVIKNLASINASKATRRTKYFENLASKPNFKIDGKSKHLIEVYEMGILYLWLA